MHITDVAENLGLVAPGAIHGIVFGLPVDEFCRLVEITTTAIFADERTAGTASASTAVFASSSLRSDSGCRCWSCRHAKLDALARYACLYADRLIVPISLTSLLNDEDPARFAIADLYYKVSVLRPLFDANIAVFAPDIHCFCLGCGHKFDNLCDAYDAASFGVYLERIGLDIRVIYRPPARGRSWYVELEGPPQYIPHGHLVMQPLGDYSRTPRWAPKRLSPIGGRLGAEMDQHRTRTYRVGGTHFGQLARDAVIQQYHGIRYNAPYITDSPVEARFLERVYPRDDNALNLRVLLEHMQHELPLLTDVPLRRILKIRQSDYESFSLYRNALQQVIREHFRNGQRFTSDVAHEICADMIMPQIRRLKLDAVSKRRSAIRRALSGTVAVSATLGFGLISGIIPLDLERLFQIGGVALAGKLGDILAAMEKHPAEIRSHNMYFLLRLVNN
jgi:hypothetical protein